MWLYVWVTDWNCLSEYVGDWKNSLHPLYVWVILCLSVFGVRKYFRIEQYFFALFFLRYFAARLLSTTCPIRHLHTRTAMHLPVSLSVRPLMLSSSFWCRSLLHAQANAQRTVSWQLFLFARKLFTRWRRFVRWLYHSSIILSTISPSPLRHCLFLFFLSSCLSFSSGRPSDRLFLDASLHLYKRVCPFVRPSVQNAFSQKLRDASDAVYPALLSPLSSHPSFSQRINQRRKEKMRKKGGRVVAFNLKKIDISSYLIFSSFVPRLFLCNLHNLVFSTLLLSIFFSVSRTWIYTALSRSFGQFVVLKFPCFGFFFASCYCITVIGASPYGRSLVGFCLFFLFAPRLGFSLSVGSYFC